MKREERDSYGGQHTTYGEMLHKKCIASQQCTNWPAAHARMILITDEDNAAAKSHCKNCVFKNGWIHSCVPLAPNMKVTGTAWLYRAASVLTVGLAGDLQRPFFYKSGVLYSMALDVQFMGQYP